MARPANLGDLTAEQWQQLQDVLDRFEQAWQQSGNADLTAFVPAVDEPLHHVLLIELVKSELEIRWRRGEAAIIEDYLRRFPQLKQDAVAVPGLLAEEYGVRHRYGDRPALTVYQKRFPQHFASLDCLIQAASPAVPTAAQVEQARTDVRTGLPRTPQPSSAASPSAASQPSLAIGGGYRLVKRLGSGTFGEVWRAEAPGGVEVAIKIVHRPLDHAEAQRELQALSLIKGLRHPFIIQVQAFWALEDRLVIAMELADCSLRDELKRSIQAGLPGIPPAELLKYMHESCQALDYLHTQRVLHRDIKPDNILLLQGYAKLADLGLARLLEVQRTFAATMCGSPPYMAPEIWRGRASARSDEYSLAATYVELRRNRVPFPGSNPAEIMLGHYQMTPKLDPIPDAEQEVLLKALSKEPAQRYASCMEFFHALADAVKAKVGSTAVARARKLAPPPPPPPPPGPSTPEGPFGTFLPVEQSPLAPSDDTSEEVVAASTPILEQPQSMRVASTLEAPPAPPGRLAPVLWASVGLAAVLLAGLVLWSLIHPGPSPQPTGNGGIADQGGNTQRDTAASTGQATAPRVLLPQNCRAAPGAREVPLEDGRIVHNRILFHGHGLHDRPVAFLLVRQQGGEDLPTFYIQETKVSNAVFVTVKAATGLEVTSPWQLGALGGKDNSENMGIGAERADHPVFRVSVDEAQQFAQRFPNGQLPSARQWDKAAGRSTRDRPPGPFLEKDLKWSKGEFALALDGVTGDRGGPLPVGTATRDQSPFVGCRDLASNGYEWTSSTGDEGAERPVPFDTEQDVDVFLRGMTYLSPTPLTFSRLSTGAEVASRRNPGSRAAEISFRVVLKWPGR